MDDFSVVELGRSLWAAHVCAPWFRLKEGLVSSASVSQEVLTIGIFRLKQFSLQLALDRNPGKMLLNQH